MSVNANTDGIGSGVNSVSGDHRNSKCYDHIVYALQRSIPDLPRILTDLSQQRKTSADDELRNLVNGLTEQFKLVCSHPQSLYMDNDAKLNVLNAEIDYVKALYVKNLGGHEEAIKALETKYNNCTKLLIEATNQIRTRQNSINQINNMLAENSSNVYNPNFEFGANDGFKDSLVEDLNQQLSKYRAEITELTAMNNQLKLERADLFKSINDLRQFCQSDNVAATTPAPTTTNTNVQRQDVDAKERRDLVMLLRIIEPTASESDIQTMLGQINAYLMSVTNLNDTVAKLERDLNSINDRYKESNASLTECIQSRSKILTEQATLEERLNVMIDDNVQLVMSNDDLTKSNNSLRHHYEDVSARIAKIFADYRELNFSTNENNSQLLYNLLKVLFDTNLTFVHPSEIIPPEQAQEAIDVDINGDDDDDEDEDAANARMLMELNDLEENDNARDTMLIDRNGVPVAINEDTQFSNDTSSNDVVIRTIDWESSRTDTTDDSNQTITANVNDNSATATANEMTPPQPPPPQRPIYDDATTATASESGWTRPAENLNLSNRTPIPQTQYPNSTLSINTDLNSQYSNSTYLDEYDDNVVPRTPGASISNLNELFTTTDNDQQQNPITDPTDITYVTPYPVTNFNSTSPSPTITPLPSMPPSQALSPISSASSSLEWQQQQQQQQQQIQQALQLPSLMLNSLTSQIAPNQVPNIMPEYTTLEQQQVVASVDLDGDNVTAATATIRQQRETTIQYPTTSETTSLSSSLPPPLAPISNDYPSQPILPSDPNIPPLVPISNFNTPPASPSPSLSSSSSSSLPPQQSQPNSNSNLQNLLDISLETEQPQPRPPSPPTARTSTKRRYEQETTTSSTTTTTTTLGLPDFGGLYNYGSIEDGTSPPEKLYREKSKATRQTTMEIDRVFENPVPPLVSVNNPTNMEVVNDDNVAVTMN